ncbi:MAG: hypothetical protein JNL72_06270 [Flavipsychrobacter sp.]|nr:hypothetical protein [Flavipsychrobacter sp.]
MKKAALIITTGIALALSPACKKKERGVCYCSYLSGDKKEYNLSSLSRSQQTDSCYVLDGYAENFAGSCKLK